MMCAMPLIPDEAGLKRQVSTGSAAGTAVKKVGFSRMVHRDGPFCFVSGSSAVSALKGGQQCKS